MRWSNIFLPLLFACGVAPLNFTENDVSLASTEKPFLTSPTCTLICSSSFVSPSWWRCSWQQRRRDCHYVTRDIMRNAETSERIMNASTSSVKHISLGSSFSPPILFEDGFLRDYPHLTKFSMEGWYTRTIQRIKANMFEGVEELTELTIRHCGNLTEIEDGAFEKLKLLQILDLSRNRLARITNKTFENLVSLTKLYLSFNSLSDIHEDAFKDLTNVEIIDLRFNKLTRISNTTFKDLDNLRSIDLSDNPLLTVSSGMFNFSKKIEYIRVGCQSYRHWSCFSRQHQLSVLTIERGGLATHNKLSSVVVKGCLVKLEPSVFESLNARNLSIENNERLKTIRGNIFKGAKELEWLSFSYNGIETISHDSFQDVSLKNLRSLDLSHNNLKIIQTGTFDTVTLLKKLDLSFNLITTITPHYFKHLESLDSLSLQSNQINNIFGDAFSNLGSLVNLNLQNNSLKNVLDVSFQGLSFLRELDLSSNKLKTISSGDFHLHTLPQLHTLLLKRNQIWKIDYTFLQGRKIIDLSENALTYVNGSFEGTWLNLSQNMIEKVDFEYLDVYHLILDNNHITDTSFLMEPKFMIHKSLDISFNDITEVSNPIENVLQPYKYECKYKYKYKYYHIHLNISGNPWKCSCDPTDRNLMQFLLTHNIIPCCSKSCKSSSSIDNTVSIDCSSLDERSLPSCLPYERIHLDYSKNNLTNLSFTSDLENITRLNLSENSIISINGTSLKFLPDLTYLNLEYNDLKNLPQEMKQLSGTKIHLEGNVFACDNCSLVNILDTISHKTEQNIICAKQQLFPTQSFRCYITCTIVPSTGLSLFFIIFLIACYTVSLGLYRKLLRRTYEQKTVIIRSKVVWKMYKQECKILRGIGHQNVRKMHTNISIWIPIFKRVGYIFLEKVTCTMGEVLSGTVDPFFPLDVPTITKDLISAVHHLHSRKHPIYHGRLGLQTVYLQNDILNETFIVKIGDFGHAKIFIPTDSSLPNEENDLKQEDLQALGKIIFALFTKKERNEPITREEIMELPNIEFGILILALQNGMMTAEVLQAAPFHSADQKKSILGELNGHLKLIKNHDKSAAILLEAEENACLVIGGKGAWNKQFELAIREEFALDSNGYNIASFIDLLRIIRNMLEHGHEQPNCMLAAFEMEKPTSEQIFLKISKKFPLFYLHSLYCFYRFFDERNALSKTFMITYKRFEDFLCRRGLDDGSLLPVQDASVATIKYKSLSDTVERTMTSEKTKSYISITDFLLEITETIQDLWRDVLTSEVIFKYRETMIPNPFLPINAAKKARIPEGSILEILKPELRVRLPSGTVTLKFRVTDKIEFIKGMAMRNLAPAVRKKVKFDEVIVTSNDRRLKAEEKLVDIDFTNHILIVDHPLVEE